MIIPEQHQTRIDLIANHLGLITSLSAEEIKERLIPVIEKFLEKKIPVEPYFNALEINSSNYGILLHTSFVDHLIGYGQDGKMKTLERHRLSIPADIKTISEPYTCTLELPKDSVIYGLSNHKRHPEILVSFPYTELYNIKYLFHIVPVGTKIPENAGRFLGSFILDVETFGKLEFAVFYQEDLATVAKRIHDQLK